MDDSAFLTFLIIPVLMSISTGIIVTIIEYWVIKPAREAKDKEQAQNSVFDKQIQQAYQNDSQDIGSGQFSIIQTLQEKIKLDPQIVVIYRNVAVGLTALSGGILSAFVIRLIGYEYYINNPDSLLSLIIMEPLGTSDFVFFFVLLITSIFGVVISLGLEVKSGIGKAIVWQRLLLAIIVGFLGGCGGSVIVVVGLIIWFAIEGNKGAVEK
jgi:hypothetical protein